MKVEDLADMWLDHVRPRITVSTFDIYWGHTNVLKRFMKDRRVTKALVMEWHKSMLDSGLGKKYVQDCFSAIRSMYAWCLENELVKENPIVKFTYPPTVFGPRPFITLDEHQRILAVADAHEETDVWPYAVRCAWETGLRLSDVCRLKWSNILWDECGIRTTPLKTQRFGKVVEIPLNDAFMGFLMREHLKVGRPADGYISVQMASQYNASSCHYSAQFRHYIAGKAGVKKGFHAYRHAAVTRWLAQGISAAIVSTITGQTIDQVMAYCQLTLSDKRKAMGFASKYDHTHSI